MIMTSGNATVDALRKQALAAFACCSSETGVTLVLHRYLGRSYQAAVDGVITTAQQSWFDRAIRRLARRRTARFARRGGLVVAQVLPHTREVIRS